MNKRLILLDIDGTIADDTVRRDLFHRTDSMTWKDYFDLMLSDAPILSTINIVDSILSIRYPQDLILVTGRPYSHETLIREWLSLHTKFLFVSLLTRPTDEVVNNCELKKRYIDSLPISSYASVIGIDDNPDVISMYSSYGFTTIHIPSNSSHNLIDRPIS